MFTYVRIRRGRWLALVLCILGLTAVGQAQIQLRGPPLNQRPSNQQVTDPNSGAVFTVSPHVQLMPGKPTIVPLNNGSLGDWPLGNNTFVYGYPPEQGGITGGIGGGIGGGGLGGGGFGGGGLGGGGLGGIGGGGLGGFGGGIGGALGFGGTRAFLGGPAVGFSGFGGSYAGFGGAVGALGGGF